MNQKLCIHFGTLLSVAVISVCSSMARGQEPPIYPPTIDGGMWESGHVQGVAVNPAAGHVYFSFTNLLVKTDLEGNLLGTIGGFTGHLGDLDFNAADGRVYGSLEYKLETSFYIAIIDVAKIDEVGMTAQNSDHFQTVYLPEVVADYTADMDGDGVFDGNTGKTADHRFGCSGIDGVSFGPKFGETEGKRYLTVAYGVYSNHSRKDNDHQVLLQYDADHWIEKYARPLSEAAPHRSGPKELDGKYFARTGNTTYGVQNLVYDPGGKRWLLGVYPGTKPAFPNYGLFAIEAATKPIVSELEGTGEKGALLALSPLGEQDRATGIRGWHQIANTGLTALGDGYFYIAESGKKDGKQTAKLVLHRWVGKPTVAFEKVTPND